MEGSRAAMRASAARVTSSQLTSPRSIRRRSTWAGVHMLHLDNAGDDEIALPRVGRLGQDRLAGQRRPHLIGAKDVLHRDRVTGRLDARRVQLLEPLEVLEDDVQVLGEL